MNGSKETSVLVLWGPQCSRLHFFLTNLKECRIQPVIIIHRDLVLIPLLGFGSVSFFFYYVGCMCIFHVYFYYSSWLW